MGWAIRARQRGEEMLKRIATSLASGFDALALMKVSQEVRRSQDEKFVKDASLDEENSSFRLEDASLNVEVEKWKAISVCRLNTWNGGEVSATRRNLVWHFLGLREPLKRSCNTSVRPPMLKIWISCIALQIISELLLT